MTNSLIVQRAAYIGRHGPKLSFPQQFFKTQYESILADPKSVWKGYQKIIIYFEQSVIWYPNVSDSTTPSFNPSIPDNNDISA